MKSTEPRRRGERGFSLIETLVALSLFAMTAATMGKFLVTQIRFASNNHLQTKAYSLAAEQLEATRALRFNDMLASSKTVAFNGVTYTVATDIDDDTPSNGLKTIEVDVSWSDPTGPKNVSVSTIYTEVRRF
jgi:prepilin-type N-terminal cleavage/methylation domain-containing protein